MQSSRIQQCTAAELTWARLRGSSSAKAKTKGLNKLRRLDDRTLVLAEIPQPAVVTFRMCQIRQPPGTPDILCVFTCFQQFKPMTLIGEAQDEPLQLETIGWCVSVR
eukprot:5187582-Karenia_brevis.AAC.1